MLPGAGYWVQQPRCLCPLSVISDKSEGMSSLNPHRSSTRRMRRRTGCGRGCAQRSRARNRERGPQVFMIFLPALRFLTGPRPPGDLAARFLAAVIRPPLLFFTVITPSLVLQTGHCKEPVDCDMSKRFFFWMHLAIGPRYRPEIGRSQKVYRQLVRSCVGQSTLVTPFAAHEPG